MKNNLSAFIMSSIQSSIDYWAARNNESGLNTAQQLYLVSREIGEMAYRIEQDYKQGLGYHANQTISEGIDEDFS
jgi:hypothetical protein